MKKSDGFLIRVLGNSSLRLLKIFYFLYAVVRDEKDFSICL